MRARHRRGGEDVLPRQDRVVHTVGVEQLLPKRLVVRAGRPTRRGEGVSAPEALGVRPRVLREADAFVATVQHVVAVHVRQVREEILDRLEVLVDVGVDHRAPSESANQAMANTLALRELTRLRHQVAALAAARNAPRCAHGSRASASGARRNAPLGLVRRPVERLVSAWSTPDHEDDRRRLDRDRFAHHLGTYVKEFALAELDLVVVAPESGAPARDEVELLLAPVRDFLVRYDELLGLRGLVCVDAEAGDPEVLADLPPVAAVVRDPGPLTPPFGTPIAADLVETSELPGLPLHLRRRIVRALTLFFSIMLYLCTSICCSRPTRPSHAAASWPPRRSRRPRRREPPLSSAPSATLRGSRSSTCWRLG